MLFELIRAKQYYKNFLVFLVLLFAGEALNLNSILFVLLGFASLCLISSTNYILNDIIDYKKDREDSGKKKRVIASGKISILFAGIVAGFFSIISLILAWLISLEFFYAILLLFFLTQMYSLFFKKIIFLDILFISINFVIRAVSGTFILDVRLSPWLVICMFFLSLFLAVGKRKGEFANNGNREVLKEYSTGLLDKLLIITSTLLIMSYSFYSFMSVYSLLITLPIVVYSVLRYFYLIENNSFIIRNPEKVFLDRGMFLSVLIWIFLCVFLIY